MLLSIHPLNDENRSLLNSFNCIPAKAASDSDMKEYEDLNEFFREDAYNYQNQLLAKTYLIVNESEQLIGAYSVANDKIEKTNKISRPIPNDKRMPYYPAVKLARFGIQTPFQSQGYGRQILDSIALSFADYHNKTGCRFLTLDAISSAKKFYEKYEFKEILQYSTNNKSFMVKDLISFADL